MRIALHVILPSGNPVTFKPPSIDPCVDQCEHDVRTAERKTPIENEWFSRLNLSYERHSVIAIGELVPAPTEACRIKTVWLSWLSFHVDEEETVVVAKPTAERRFAGARYAGYEELFAQKLVGLTLLRFSGCVPRAERGS